MDSQCSIELFGGIRVEQGKRVITRFRTQKTASLIAYLAYFGDRMHPRDVLTEMLWPGAASQAAAKTSLSVALCSLRSQLEPPPVPAHSLLLADRQSVGLSSLVTTDTSRFEKAVRQAERAHSRKERDEEKRLLLTALALYRDKFLPGFDDIWISSQQERLAAQFRRAVRRLSSLYEEDGDLDAAIACAQRAVQSDPFDEEVSQDLIRLLLKNDDQSSGEMSATAPSNAVKHYRLLEKALKQTGQTPSSKTRELVAPLLKHASSRKAPASVSFRRSRLMTATLAELRESASVFAVSSASQKRKSRSAAEVTSYKTPPATAPDALPHPITRFFGRQEELAFIEQLLEFGEHRLITLTGPGGTGKTRIALETARRQRQRAEETREEDDSAPDVYFVSLIEAVNADLFIAALRVALGIREEPRPDTDPLLPLAHALKERRTLLVLDNFEQIAEAGAEVLERLLQRVPGLTCLVTSRQRLPILGEREIAIAPFAATAPSLELAIGSGGDQGLSALLEQPGIALFVDRAQLARPDFQITSRNAASIVELVHRLEGIPLAIELAAARTQVLTPRQMMNRMGKRLDLLVSHRKVIGGRHQSLRDTLQFSYELLSPSLKVFFGNLALFRGGFTTEAAEAVTASSIALDLLAQLCDASLIRATEQGNGETRFQMLETVREFAREKQQEGDPNGTERLQAEANHLAFFAQFAEETDKCLVEGKMQGEYLALLEADHDNFRAALRRTLRSVASSVAATEALRLIASLHNFWLMRGYLTEGRGWDRQYWKLLRDSKVSTERAGTLDPALLARAVNGAGVLAMTQGDYAAADRCYRYSLWLRRRQGDHRSIAAILNNAGLSYSKQGDLARARSLYERSLEGFRTLNDTRMISRLVANLGILAAEQGDFDTARRHFEEGLKSARHFGETRAIAIRLRNLGHAYYKLGNFAKAEKLLMESLSCAHDLQDHGRSAATLLCLGFVRSARVAWDASHKTAVQAERETGPQFLRIALESYKELNIPLPSYATAEMERFPAAEHKANGFPFAGLQALQDILERWLPEHAV